MSDYKVLNLSGDPALQPLLQARYDTRAAADVQELAGAFVPDLVLLDLDHHRDGLRVLRRLRETGAAVVALSARQDERAVVEALDAGADDYLTKPVRPGELLARIRAALRQKEKHTPEGVFAMGGLRIDYPRRRISVDERAVHLTPTEYQIVTLLARSAGEVIPREMILTAIWGPFGGDSQVLRVNIANIRRKLEQNAARPRYILTEPRIGYRMADRL